MPELFLNLDQKLLMFAQSTDDDIFIVFIKLRHNIFFESEIRSLRFAGSSSFNYHLILKFKIIKNQTVIKSIGIDMLYR